MPRKSQDTEAPKIGRPKKIEDSDILATLMDVKIAEQLSWADLAEWYTSEYGEEISDQTIRRAIMKDAPMLLVPERVSRKVKKAIDTVWDQVDIMRLIMFGLQGRFTEWSMLYEKMIRCSVDEEADEAFTDAERDRMDILWDGISSFFLRAMTIMRDLRAADVAVPELEMLVRVNAPTAETGQVEGRVTMGALNEVVAQVAEQTKGMMEALHARHKEEGRGYYRQLPEPEDDENYDLLEIDE